MPRYETIWNPKLATNDCFVDGEQVSYEVFMETQREEGRERARAATEGNRQTLREFPINTAVMVVDPEGLTDTWFGVVVGYGMSQRDTITLTIDKIGGVRVVALDPLAVEKV